MNSKSVEQTYYEILEVSITAPHHEIVAAYQRAKNAYAADSPALYTMFTKEEADELRKLIEEAFHTLGNQAKRKEYDQVLFSRQNPPTKMELPDFAPISESQTPTVASPAPAKSGETRPAKSASPATVPEGFIRGRLSVYEVKPALEDEISSQKNFDGPFLRKVRQYKNINLDQLSKETRISRSYLAALESDDYEALPAPVFLRGFVIQVARVLGLDENLAASSYMSRLKGKE